MKVQNLKNSKTKKITNKSSFFSSDRREVQNNQIKILLSAEHRNYVEDIEKCFDDLNIKVEAGYVRKSIEELSMQVLIFLTGAITTGVTWDLIKIGIKKIRERFKKVGIRIIDKNQNIYNIPSEGQITIFLVFNGKTKVISNIKTVEDLFNYLQNQNNGWQKVKLGDLGIEIIDGDRGINYPKKEDFFNIGYCLFLNTKNVTDRGFLFSEVNFITEEKDKMLRKGKIRRNDVILTTRGTVGNVAFYNEKIPFQNMRINSGMVIIRPNGINSQFNYQLFKYLRKDFLNFSSGSAQPQLPIRDMKNISVHLPPLFEQEAIAEVLSSLDDKIELLHRQNKTLENIAQTLFHKWFIEDAKDDWKEGFIPDEFNFIMGLSPPGKSYNKEKNGLPMFQGNADFGFRFPKNRIYTTDPKRIVEPLSTLISVRAPVGEQNMALEKCCIGRGVAGFSYKNNQNFYTYTYYKMKSLINEIRQFNQIGTVFGSINKQDFNSFPISVPPVNAVKNFQNIVKPIDDKVILNCIQIRKLENLRDTLLSKLMNRKIKVKCLN